MNLFGSILNGETAANGVPQLDSKSEHIYCLDHLLQLITIAAFSAVIEDKEESDFPNEAPTNAELENELSKIEEELDEVMNSATNTLASKKGLLKLVRRLIQYFNKSTQAADDLLRMHQAANADSNMKGLIQDVCTRWWSTFAMIERLLAFKAALVSYNSSKSFPAPKTITNKEGKL